MAVFSGNKGDNGDGETAVFSPAGAATATLPLADMPPRPPAGAEQATQLLPDAAADFTDNAGTQVLTGATTPMPDQTTPMAGATTPMTNTDSTPAPTTPLAERTTVLPTPQPSSFPRPAPPRAVGIPQATSPQRWTPPFARHCSASSTKPPKRPPPKPWSKILPCPIRWT